MPPKNNPFIRFMWALHKWLYGLTGGRIGARLLDMPVLLLHTTGRKTGTARLHALSYVRAGDAYAIAASNAGADVSPGWYFNLLEAKRARIQVGAQTLDVTVRQTEGAERQRLWEEFKAMEAAYSRYEKRTPRQIPVLLLEPVEEK